MKRIFTNGVKTLILFIVLLVFLSTMFYHYIESWTWIDSMYFTIMTITTVGHGNLIPSTTASKLFTSFVAFVGIAMVLTLFGIISSHYVKIVNNK